MKYLTITVPCYNSQDYLDRCVKSLLTGGQDVEILLIDDGSRDRTGAMADAYAEAYPDIVRVVHKENGGHGSGVNKGLELATGRYFKVVDSDDWLDPTALGFLLEAIRRSGREEPDLYICNYVYDHLDQGRSTVMDYRNLFPADRVCGWQDLGHFRPSQYLIMHAQVFRTEVLRRSGVQLPEHTFYVDNIFANEPLPWVRTLRYLDLDLYHYYLGRSDQSVNEQVLMRRIDQQIYVTEYVSFCTDLEAVRRTSPKLERYLVRNISIMMAISDIHLLLIHTAEADEKRRQLWNGIRRRNPALYRRLRYASLCGWTNLPGPLGDWLTLNGYRLAKRVYQFQ